MAAAILVFLAFKKKKVRTGIISMMLISVFAIGAVYAADGFVINKIDDNGDPVEVAVFDIYGKPEVTWEEITIPEGKVEIRIKKIWEDGGDQDGIRPDEVKVNITADGEKLTQAVVKNSDEWYYTLGDLPRYDSTGAEIAYRWEEEPVNGYSTASYKADTHYDGNDKFIDLTITNSHTPATTDITLTKTWDDGGDADGTRPAASGYAQYLTLKADGTAVNQAPVVTDNNDNTYTVTWRGLDKNKAGTAIAYTVEESAIAGYTAGTIGGNAADGFALTNTHVPMVTITGTKHWIDGGRTHDNASEVTLTLYRRVSGNVDAEQVVGATPTWDGNKYTFANQPISDRSGNGYVYWVIEEPVEGYDVPQHTSETGDAVGVPGAPNGGLITNELSQEYVEITVTKQWDDASNQDGKRPDELTLALYRTGKDGDETYTQKVNWVTPEVSKSGNDWTYTFKNQLKYDSQRYEFIYEVREETVPDGYTCTYCDGNGNPLPSSATGTRNGGSIKNTHTPETITVSGTKTWTSSTGNNDDLDTSKIPEKYTVRLEKSTDGTNWTTVDSQEVSSSMAPPPMSPTDPMLPVDKWTFSDLPAKDGGVDIQYRVVEVTVPDGFTMSGGTKDANGEYNLTNTYTPTTSSVNIKVGLTHRIFPEASWSDIVANQQKVTVSGGSMTDKVLSFTPGTAAQEVELPGAGTYTISMTGITQSDLQQEDALRDKVFDYMPLLIDTVSVTVTVDESGNCTVSGSPAYVTFVFGMDQGETFVYNDIEALKEAYYGADDGLDKRNPHSENAGAVASGNTVTLTTVISQVWNPYTEIEVI